MAQCEVCFNLFDDDKRQCFVVCSGDHTLCRTCLDQVKASGQVSCPLCRQPISLNPRRVRLHQPSQMEKHDPMELDQDPKNKDRKEDKEKKDIVIALDISGSMQGQSAESVESPIRLEMAVHMAKIMLAFCRKMSVHKCSVYTFSNTLVKLNIDHHTGIDAANRVLERLRPDAGTSIGVALDNLFRQNGPDACYFVFTDGQPTDDWQAGLSLYANTQLHLTAFSKDTSLVLLNAVAGNPLHTISYIEDVRSIAAYMIPVFVLALTGMRRVEMSSADEECRKMYAAWLRAGVHRQMTRADIGVVMSELAKRHRGVMDTYAGALARDTSGDSMHSRIEIGTLDSARWHAFGKFYNICALQCHEFLIPNNIFDVALEYYRTDAYKEIYLELSTVPDSVRFVAFIATSRQAESEQSVSRATQYVSQGNYGSAGDEGCIGPDELIGIWRNGLPKFVPMKDVRLSDCILFRNRLVGIKWIIRVHNLEHGRPITLYDGLTVNHPCLDGGKWVPASQIGKETKVVPGDTVLYDVVLEDQSVPSMVVNGKSAALVGYPALCGDSVHPYWGTQAVIHDMEARCPGGGFVDLYF